MARPIKKGLNYFPFETGFFQTERAQMLKARFGADGITLYIDLLCKVYGEGYFLEIEDKEDFYFILASELGFNQNKVRQIVRYLLKRSMFDAHLFNTVNVLTAAEIQTEYVCAMRRRKHTVAEVRGKHWLLTEEQERDLETFYKSTIVPSYSEKNPNKSQKNPDNSAIYDTEEKKGKERKENETKGDETEKQVSKKEQRGLESYAEIMNNFSVSGQVKESLWELIRHCQLNGRTMTNDKLEKLIVRLDMEYSNEQEKAAALTKAVAKGYFDIK